MKNSNFELFKGREGQYYFRLRAQNGEIILNSEAYTTKKGAENGIMSVHKHADKRFIERKYAKDGRGYFVLKASNGRIIGMSEFYRSKAAREVAVSSVIKNARSSSL